MHRNHHVLITAILGSIVISYIHSFTTELFKNEDLDKSAVTPHLPRQCSINAMIYSARENFDKRQIIRKSWGKWFDKVHFILGDQGCGIPPSFRLPPTSCTAAANYDKETYSEAEKAHVQSLQTVENALRMERAVYHDLILLPMIDYYDNLPQKFFGSLETVLHLADSRSNRSLILKLDDDFTPAHTRKLLKSLCGHVESMGNAVLNTAVLFGTFMTEYIHRRGKYASLHKAEQQWYFAMWDPFPYGGAGYAMTPVLAESLVTHKGFLSRNMTQLEDVNIGIFLPKLQEHFNMSVTKVYLGQDFFPSFKFWHHIYTSFIEP
jgi:hypothetical protein